ncbi:MAG: CstA-like transporter-associated (seleno)protein [Steroidobacteraceae bacterium]
MRSRIATFWRALRQLTGDDAYDRYLRAHSSRCGRPLLSRRDFYAQREQSKWSSIQRCC